MITPIREMTINQIMKRKDDLLVSGDDINEIADNVRKKAIDNFVSAILEKVTEEERNGNYRFYACELKQCIADLGEQLKSKTKR